MRTARLLFQTYRFEAVSVLIAAALLAGAGLYVSSRLDAALGDRQDCLIQWQETAGEVSGECGEVARDFYGINEAEAGKVMAAMAILPFVAGLLIGVPLVGREIEHRTTALAWSLKSSRSRWLLKRAVIAAVALGVVLAVPATTAEVLEGSRVPGVDPAGTFEDYGLRGPLTVFRGLAALGIGLLGGALIGRVLPALIVGFVGVLALVWVLTNSQWAFLPEADLVPADEFGGIPRGGLYAGSPEGPLYRDGQGNLLTFDQVTALSPYPPDGSEERFYRWIDEEFDEMVRYIPGERLGIVVVREAVGLSVFSVVLVGLTAVVVTRRRPY